MKISNNKGVLQGIPLVFWSLVAVNIGISQLPPVKDAYRLRRSIEVCQETNGISYDTCKILMEASTKEDRLASIQDNDMTGDKGFASGSKGPDLSNISKLRTLEHLKDSSDTEFEFEF